MTLKIVRNHCNILILTFFYKFIYIINIILFKIQKKIIHYKILPPYKITQLELGTYKTNCNYIRKELYAGDREYSCLHPEYKILETRKFEHRFIYEVSDVVVDTVTGNVFDHTSSLIFESTSWSKSWHVLANSPGVNSRPMYHQFLKYQDKNSIILPSNSYFHWVSEDIAPVIFLLKHRPTLDILVYKNAPNYVFDFLIGNNLNFRLVERYIKFKDYEFVSKIKDNSWPDLADLKIVRSYYQIKFENKTDNNCKKIFISRLNSRRSPSFEKDLCSTLSNNGWEIMFAEDLKLSDQIEKLRTANIIAGIQGAGLIGAIWSENPCTLVEITDANWRYTPVLARLASALKISFKRIEYSESDDMVLETILRFLDNIVKNS